MDGVNFLINFQPLLAPQNTLAQNILAQWAERLTTDPTVGFHRELNPGRARQR